MNNTIRRWFLVYKIFFVEALICRYYFLQFASNLENSRNLVPAKLIPSKVQESVYSTEKQVHSSTLKQVYTLKYLYSNQHDVLTGSNHFSTPKQSFYM